MVGHVAHGGKLPLTLFRPPLPQHAQIVPQGKALDYIENSNLYKVSFHTIFQQKLLDNVISNSLKSLTSINLEDLYIMLLES